MVELGVLVDIELEGGRIFPPPGWRLDAPVALCADRGKPRRSLWLLARTGLMPGQHMPTGPIVAISYVSDKGDGPHTYRHAFEGSLPALALDAQGHAVIRRRRSLYTVDWRGIVG